MRYPAVKLREVVKKVSQPDRKKTIFFTTSLTDCGKTCTLTKLQTADPGKFEAKYANLCKMCEILRKFENCAICAKFC